MLEQILSSFAGSSEAGSVVRSLVDSGLSPTKAQEAVVATAEGAKEAVGQGGIGALLSLAGGGGGGGGLMGALGGMLGGGSGAAAPAAGGSFAGPIADQIAGFVAQKVGIDPSMARTVVNIALPKVIEFVKSKGGGLGGGLGGLLG